VQYVSEVSQHVIEKERALEFGGKCVEAIPHIRDEILRRYEHSAAVNRSDISIIEIGGTVGDYQNVMFIEAARVLKMRHPNDVIFIMVSYLPTPGTLGEMKSRPTQHAVRQLSSYGVNADIIIARATQSLDKRRKEKIAVSCNIPHEHVISAPDIESIYDVPVNFEHDKLDEIVLEALQLPKRKIVLSGRGSSDASLFKVWREMARGIKNHGKNEVNIAIVGKYFNTGNFVLTDSYISVLEAIKFSAYKVGVKAIIHTINARDYEDIGKGKYAVNDLSYSRLDSLDGIIVPGGFGETGIEGKINVIKYAREQRVPFFGLCYGMQLMTIEYARNVLSLAGAHTAEIDPSASHLIIDIMLDQKRKVARDDYGGSMRLGLYPAKLIGGTIADEAYSSSEIVYERHRHRYEVNPKYIDRLEKGGLIFSGKSPDGKLMEIAELPREKHPFFLGTQFHPEFLARPLAPHPLFTEFVKATKLRAKKRKIGTETK
jgi:CTP synthase